jgi:hypothetical protein
MQVGPASPWRRGSTGEEEEPLKVQGPSEAPNQPKAGQVNEANKRSCPRLKPPSRATGERLIRWLEKEI